MKASSRSHHQGYGNLGPASGGYLPPMSTAERRREKGRRGVKVCCVLDRQWGEGAVQESYFIGFKSAWQFLEAGAGWDSDYSSSSSNTTLILPATPPSPQLSTSSRLMSPCLAFVTDHPAPICPDYRMSSIMDCSEGQEGLIPMNRSPLFGVHRSLDFTNQNMNGFICLLI